MSRSTCFSWASLFAVAFSFMTGVAQAQSLPVLERIEPTSGPPGTEVQLVGRAFDANTRAFLGARECEVIARLPNRWTCRIPANGTSAPIFLRNAAGQSSAFPFAVTAAPPAPVVQRFEPTSGPPGTEVTVYGQNFSTRMTENVVTLGALPLVVRAATPSSLRVTIADGAQTGPFTVRVANAGQAASSSSFTVTVPTAITGFSPTIGAPGSRVVITGTGFSPSAASNRVYINNLPVRVERATATTLNVLLPQNVASGPFLVDVRNGGRAQSATAFQVQFPPVIVSFDPPAAPPGRIITIRGTNFGTDIRAVQTSLNGVALTMRNLQGGTEIQAEIPANAATGRLSVTVNGLGPANSSTDFRVLPPLTVSGFAPTSGPAGTVVTLSGTGFAETPTDNAVVISGVRAEVISASATALTIRMPMTLSGLIDVNVRYNGTVRTATPFVLTRPPIVNGFEPERVTVGGSVIIRGTNFGTNAQTVEATVNGARLAITAITDTQITAVVPAGTTTGRISVSVQLQGTSTTGRSLEVVQPFSITSMEPATGSLGTPIVLRGVGFSQGAQVLFAPNITSQALVVNDTEIRTVIPAGAATGVVRVRLTDGRIADAPVQLTVGAPPEGVAITAIEPTCTRPGCTVRLRGYGFAGRANQNNVFFGDISVRVTAASPDSLTITLPSRANQAFPFRVTPRGKPTAQSAVFAITQ